MADARGLAPKKYKTFQPYRERPLEGGERLML
jgi:hypothetical protein